jgi:isoquinoline 1-oxidoreductase subunit alpha
LPSAAPTCPATRACVTPVSLVEGRSVTTIEGLSSDGSHPLQKAWIAEQVPQCDYRSPMSAFV